MSAYEYAYGRDPLGARSEAPPSRYAFTQMLPAVPEEAPPARKSCVTGVIVTLMVLLVGVGVTALVVALQNRRRAEDVSSEIQDLESKVAAQGKPAAVPAADATPATTSTTTKPSTLGVVRTSVAKDKSIVDVFSGTAAPPSIEEMADGITHASTRGRVQSRRGVQRRPVPHASPNNPELAAQAPKMHIPNFDAQSAAGGKLTKAQRTAMDPAWHMKQRRRLASAQFRPKTLQPPPAHLQGAGHFDPIRQKEFLDRSLRNVKRLAESGQLDILSSFLDMRDAKRAIEALGIAAK